MKHELTAMQKTLGLSSLLALLLTLGTASQAGTDLKAAHKAAAINTQTGVDASTVAPASNLRCWQDGTLLFEETNVSERSLNTAQQVLVFERAQKDKNGELFLIETGSATCLYKKA